MTRVRGSRVRGGLPVPVLLGLVATSAGLVNASPAHAYGAGHPQAVIVSASSVDLAAASVRSVGGTVDVSLPIIDAVAAHVSPAGVTALGEEPTVRVSPDVAVHPTSASFDPSALDTQADRHVRRNKIGRAHV